jgi:hypothetical protein
MNSNKILFKRLIREYEFLLEDIEDLENIKSKANSEFMEELRLIDETNVLESQGLEGAAQKWEAEKKKHKEEFLEEQDERDSVFKKMFRSIVVKCHPDKLGQLPESELVYYHKLYNDAIEANDNIDWALLIRTAIKLDVEIPEEIYSKLEEIQESLDVLKYKQNSILNSASWQWYNAKTSTNQNEFLKNHLEFLKGFNKDL